MRKLLLPALLLLCSLPSNAQFFRKIDDWFKNQQAKQPYDTTYIYRPQERWLVRTRSMFSGESLNMAATVSEDEAYAASLGTGLEFKQTIGFGYRILALDFGFSPFGKKSSAGLDINIIGNRIGVSVGGWLSYGMTGSALIKGETVEIPTSGALGMLGHADVLWAILGNKFSMPAASNQNFRQRKSAGSPLVTFSAKVYGVSFNKDVLPNSPVKMANTALIGIGGGYGYNWVPSDHWLIHISAMETIGYPNRSLLTLQDRDEPFGRETPIFLTRANLGVIYYYRSWYFGAYANFNSMDFFGRNRSELNFYLSRTETMAFATAGVRF